MNYVPNFCTNGDDNKLRIYLGGEWEPLKAARHFIAVLCSAGIEPLPLNTKDNANA